MAEIRAGLKARDREIEDARLAPCQRRPDRLRMGWREVVTRGKRYREKTLKKLTWENLGWRLAMLFGDTSSKWVEEV